MTSPCSVGPVAACSCLNGGYLSGDLCFCQSGYGGPYCQVFVGEGKRQFVCVVCSASAFSEIFKTDLIRHICIYHGVGGWGLGMGDGGVQ